MTKVFKVEGMVCDHCRMSVRRAIGALDGAKEVRVDLNLKEAKVDFDPEKVSDADIEAAIEKAGYKVVSDK